MIYLVEDDESIRELVVYTLNSQGLEAQGFERPSLFWKALEKELPSLVLLDIMLPEEDGLSILKKIRIRQCYDKAESCLEVFYYVFFYCESQFKIR